MMMVEKSCCGGGGKGSGVMKKRKEKETRGKVLSSSPLFFFFYGALPPAPPEAISGPLFAAAEVAPGAGDRRLLRLVCEMIRARSSCFCFFVFFWFGRGRGEFFFFFFDVPPLAFDHPESFSTVPLCSRFLDYEGNKSLSPAAIKRKKIPMRGRRQGEALENRER